jgi:hypothetical protein
MISLQFGHARWQRLANTDVFSRFTGQQIRVDRQKIDQLADIAADDFIRWASAASRRFSARVRSSSVCISNQRTTAWRSPRFASGYAGGWGFDRLF